jgi:hypothetical protein
MSKKNVQYTDFTAVDLSDIQLSSAGSDMYAFTAKRNGCVKINVSFFVELPTSDPTDTVQVQIFQDDGVSRTKILYTTVKGLPDLGYLSSSVIFEVVEGIDYEVVGLDLKGFTIGSGVLGVTYL